MPKSIDSPLSAPPAPEESQLSATSQDWGSIPLGLESKTVIIQVAIDREMNMQPVGSQSPWRGRRLPKKTCTTKPANGHSRTARAALVRS